MNNARFLHKISECDLWTLTRWELNGNRFVTKQLKRPHRKNEASLARLKKEDEFFQKFDHDRLLAIKTFDREEGMHVLEDVQCTLQEYIEVHGPLINDAVANVLLDVLSVIELLHAKGFCHGMLGADNVFVTTDGRVKLGDFLGYSYRRECPVPVHWRQPRYDAPETIEGNSEDCGPVSDLYCVGFLALEMLAGENFPQLFNINPAKGDKKWLNWHARMNTRLDQWPQKLPSVAQSLVPLIDGITEKDPRKRSPSSAKELANELRARGLHSRNTLPPFDSSPEREPAPDEGPSQPRRVEGPILRLTDQNGNTRSFKPALPVIVGNSKLPESIATLSISEGGLGSRHALLCCPHKHWLIYDLCNPKGTFLNEGRITIESPGQLTNEDELKFGPVKFNVDLEYQGTGLLPDIDLQKRIHSGHNGDIYRAIWYHKSGREIETAIRIFPKRFSLEADDIRRFLRSVTENREIRNRYIVSTFRSGRVRRSDRSYWFIAMELMRHSLRDLIEKMQGPLPEPLIRGFAVNVALALNMAGQHGAVHRNIMPSCILFNKSNQAKLGDFSLARQESQESVYDITRGALELQDYRYQAPEVVRGEQSASHASDLFSLAACMFEAATGTMPIGISRSLPDQISGISSFSWPDPRDLNPNCSYELAEFLNKALSRNVQERFQNAEQILGSSYLHSR